MDQYGGNNNGVPSNSSSYSSLPSIAPQQLQQQQGSNGLPPHTLPPLQAQHAAMSMHSMYSQPMSASHTPTSTQPNTPGSTGNGGFQQQQQMNSQSAQRNYHMQPSSSYPQPIQPYNSSSAMMPQSSGPMSHPHPQAIAPAPGPSHNRLVPLRPMSQAPLHNGQHPMHSMQGGMPSPYGQQQPPQEEAPTHVVGSQGRRGILPSAPGRPAVTATGPGASKNTVIPQKDENGKFPCPHCVKTYLHAKHLKRHLLRHTGDRPYTCCLCRDTFSRSDILKRHFQKCSIRRGNPTGASHLSYARQDPKKNQQNRALSSVTEGQQQMNGMNNVPTDPGLHPFGLIPNGRMGDHQSNLGDDQLSQADRLSRANSIRRTGSGDGQDSQRSIKFEGPSSNSNGSSRTSFEQGYNSEIPSSMAQMNPQMSAYSMPNGHSAPAYHQQYQYPNPQDSNGGSLHPQQNGDGMQQPMPNGRGPMPMYGGQANGQQSNLDWSNMFQP